MPFKTRKQKLAARERRFTFSDSGVVSWQVKGDDNLKMERVEESKNGKMKFSFGELENLDYVRNDLLKILALAAVIIVAQVALSFVRP